MTIVWIIPPHLSKFPYNIMQYLQMVNGGQNTADRQKDQKFVF